MAATLKKVVLVTGCSTGGIGFHLCQEFAKRGCTVYASSRRRETMKDLEGAPGIRVKELDVRSDEAVDAVVRDIVEESGQLDIVVSNAGYLCCGPLLDLPLDTVKDAFDTNVFATLRLARAAGIHMAQRRSGLIMVVGSVSGTYATPWAGVYNASKAALNNLTDVLSLELSPFGVNVTLLLAGSVRSSLSTNSSSLWKLPESSLYTNFTDAIRQRMFASQTRFATPTDVFATRVVNAALKQHPPGILRLGGGTLFWRVLAWFPRGLLLWMMWKVMGKPNKR